MSIGMLYILDENGDPKAEPDHAAWGVWFVRANRTLAHTSLGSVCVSTVFRGIAAALSRDGRALLWESMIIGGEHNLETCTYPSAAEARAGHEGIVRRLQDALTRRS